MPREGGKTFAAKTLIQFTPFYKVFVSSFCGGAIYEINIKKPKIFGWWNDIDPDLINYYKMLSRFPEYFNEMKRGPYGLIYDKNYEECKKAIEEIPFNEDWSPKEKKFRAWQYFYYKKLTNMGICKIGQVKFGRPLTNQDAGVMTEHSKKSIEKMQYIHLTTLDFRKQISRFLKRFYGSKKKKGLQNTYNVKEEEVLFFFDPPYLDQDVYEFPLTLQHQLAEIMYMLHLLGFRMMRTCRKAKLHLETFDYPGFFLTDLKTRYPGNVYSDKNSDGVVELLITNFNPEQVGRKIPPMRSENQSSIEDYGNSPQNNKWLEPI